MIYHSSHRSYFRTPAGAVPTKTKVLFRILCDEADRVFLRLWNGQETRIPMEQTGNVWQVKVDMPDTPQVLWYTFVIITSQRVQFYGAPVDQLGGEGCLYDDNTHGFQITVYHPAYHTPAYLKEGNIYQIFPDRFYASSTSATRIEENRVYHEKWNEEPFLLKDINNNYTPIDFYGGNLRGIIEKLPYLKEMGITVLYLNPIFRAASNHRYDTGDYNEIDPLLGTQADFEALCAEAKKNGMWVLLDGVFSHTGDDSRYFNKYGHYNNLGAYQGEESPFYKWYSFIQFPDVYKSWWGFSSLPEIDKSNEEYRRFMFNQQDGVVPGWIKKGACGWRLDVADELSMSFLRNLRVSARSASMDATVLGEVWEDASNKVSYGEMRCYCLGDTLDSVMNYPLRDIILRFFRGEADAYALARLITHQQEVYPACFQYALMNLLGSHDRPRAMNELCGCSYGELSQEERRGKQLTKEQYLVGCERYLKALQLLCFLPGAPTVYYGDEAGMQGGADPFCRGPFPWGEEDTCLQQKVRIMLNDRRNSAVLQTGYLTVNAPDKDTLRVVRYVKNGKDRFGKQCAGLRMLEIKR